MYRFYSREDPHSHCTGVFIVFHVLSPDDVLAHLYDLSFLFCRSLGLIHTLDQATKRENITLFQETGGRRTYQTSTWTCSAVLSQQPGQASRCRLSSLVKLCTYTPVVGYHTSNQKAIQVSLSKKTKQRWKGTDVLLTRL